MSGVKFEKGSKEFCFFREFWNLVQEYYIPEDTDEYWQSLDDNANELAEKYDDKFFDSLIIAFVTAMSNKLYEGKRRNGKQTD